MEGVRLEENPSIAVLQEKLLHALASQLLRDAHRLGLAVGETQISLLCRSLLGEPLAGQWQVRESDLFDMSRIEAHEVVDYLHLVSLELRKQHGQFVTPLAIVRHILRSVGYTPTDDILARRLIDPACGSGIFLVEALRIYLQALQRGCIPLPEWYAHAIGSMVGLDLDPKACLFARFNLAMTLSFAVLFWAQVHDPADLPPLPIHCVDTLQTLTTELSQQTLLNYDDSHPVRLHRRFDFVVGNPPYQRLRELPPILRQTFAESLYGHANAYGLFLHAGVEMLNDAGRLSFIVPRSMLSGLYFQNLRQFIVERTTLREIVHIAPRKKVFEAVLQGTMVLTLERRSATKSLDETPAEFQPSHRSRDLPEGFRIGPQQSVTVACIRSVRELGQPDMVSAMVSQQRIVQRFNGLMVWFVDNAVRTYDIIEKFIGDHPLLGGLEVGCPARTGQIVWNRVKPLLLNAADPQVRPFVWATDVSRFAFSFNAAGVARPCYLKVAPRTEQLMVHGLSLLVQRVTTDEQPSRIVACIPEEFCEQYRDGYFVENHLNFIQVAPSLPTDLFLVLGLLNSRVVEFFLRVMNGNTQVSATELNLLPVPRGDLGRDIAALARRIQMSSHAALHARLESELNHTVATAYGLSEDDLSFVKAWLAVRRGEP